MASDRRHFYDFGSEAAQRARQCLLRAAEATNGPALDAGAARGMPSTTSGGGSPPRPAIKTRRRLRSDDSTSPSCVHPPALRAIPLVASAEPAPLPTPARTYPWQRRIPRASPANLLDVGRQWERGWCPSRDASANKDDPADARQRWPDRWDMQSQLLRAEHLTDRFRRGWRGDQ
jgi:hypothetical protein